jgi:hypothetical protein
MRSRVFLFVVVGILRRTYRFKEGSNDPWCEGVLVQTSRNDEGELRGDFRYFAGSPRLPEDAGPLELEPIGIPNL